MSYTRNVIGYVVFVSVPQTMNGGSYNDIAHNAATGNAVLYSSIDKVKEDYDRKELGFNLVWSDESLHGYRCTVGYNAKHGIKVIARAVEA